SQSKKRYSFSSSLLRKNNVFSSRVLFDKRNETLFYMPKNNFTAFSKQNIGKSRGIILIL
ncbi:hypothetical protein OCF63_16575, partial [Bacillus wiedmannii]|uniref:hypothetical protein n=1 Tax=Bacillus wiedmannii TaxID=1890302 RepID=UPI0021CFAAB8